MREQDSDEIEVTLVGNRSHLFRLVKTQKDCRAACS